MSGASTAPASVHPEGAARFPVTISRAGHPILEARLADTFLARLRGLHALPPLGPLQALIIRPCNAVQTWTMHTPIDVAFLDRDHRILKLARLAPRSCSSCRGAVAVIEMVDGAIARLGLGENERLCIERQPDSGTDHESSRS